MRNRKIIILAVAGIMMVLACIAVIIFNMMNNVGITEETGMESVEKEPDTSTQAELHGSYTPLISGKVGSRIYYTDNVFKNRDLTRDEEKEIKDFLLQADKELAEDIVVVGWSRGSGNNSLMFNAYLYDDGVVVPDMFYRLWQGRTSCVQKPEDIPANFSPDTSDMIDPEELFPIVDELAVKHESELHMDQDKKIYVIYHPEYDTVKDELYYYFRINDFSIIRIDAKTGDILEEYYFNGDIDD